MNKDFDQMSPDEQRKYIRKSEKELYKRIIKDERFIDSVQYRIFYSWARCKKVFGEHPFLRLGVEISVSIVILYFLNYAINYFFMVR